MCGAAVSFNDEMRVRPEEVHDVVEQPDVHIRLGKAMPPTELQESLLELAARNCGPDLVTS